eukprot:CAMPEP_0113915960 /NCGR_PEP_ID=MMETSP0780_2-20120614/31636_1 /TAXON_ID=652834 /ORGANISM="Palpitomonas bilix" /LENGTH=55 /DNA_ID=CAMNT_0000914815 /DNA_START=267 /DNA_END=430 /DNA_ORIENTATION=- /assembly_acc=CAM_ASM_000599
MTNDDQGGIFNKAHMGWVNSAAIVVSVTKKDCAPDTDRCAVRLSGKKEKKEVCMG